MSVETAPSGAGAAIASAGPAAIEAGGTPFSFSSPISSPSIESSFGVPYTTGSINAEPNGHFEFNSALMGGLDRIGRNFVTDSITEVSQPNIFEVGHNVEIPQGIVNSFDEPAPRLFGESLVAGDFSLLNEVSVATKRLIEVAYPEEVDTFSAPLPEIRPVLRPNTIIFPQKTVEIVTEVSEEPIGYSQPEVLPKAVPQPKVINFEQARAVLQKLQPKEREVITQEIRKEVTEETAENSNIASREILFIEDEEAMKARVDAVLEFIEKQDEGEIDPRLVARAFNYSDEQISGLVKAVGEGRDGSLDETIEDFVSHKELDSKKEARDEAIEAIRANQAVTLGESGQNVGYEAVKKVLNGKNEKFPEHIVVKVVTEKLQNQVQEEVQNPSRAEIKSFFEMQQNRIRVISQTRETVVREVEVSGQTVPQLDTQLAQSLEQLNTEVFGLAPRKLKRSEALFVPQIAA